MGPRAADACAEGERATRRGRRHERKTNDRREAIEKTKPKARRELRDKEQSRIIKLNNL